MLKGLFRALPPKDTYFWFLPSFQIREPERISHLEMQIPSKTTSCVLCVPVCFIMKNKNLKDVENMMAPSMQILICRRRRHRDKMPTFLIHDIFEADGHPFRERRLETTGRDKRKENKKSGI